ncbi:MAG: hypothetical protein KDI63_12050 [Gammaproteobacteria bacterium]|nr:hypothetical protein [Gammaproteobacteria bacterium]
MKNEMTLKLCSSAGRRLVAVSAAAMVALLFAAPFTVADTMMKESAKTMDNSMKSEMSDGHEMKKDGMMEDEKMSMEKQGMKKMDETMEKADMQEMSKEGKSMMGSEMKK